MRIDDFLTFEEKRLMDKLKGKSRMEQDQIVGDCENG